MKSQKLNQRNQDAETKVEIMGGPARHDDGHFDSMPSQGHQE